MSLMLETTMSCNSTSHLLATVFLGVVLLAGASAYFVRYDPAWKLEGWNKPAGFKARITQNGLNFLKGVLINLLDRKLQEIQIPDIHGSADIFVGTVVYDVTSIKIKSFAIPQSSLTPNPSAGGVTLRASGISLAIHGNWHYKVMSIIPVSDSGSFDASAWQLSLGLTLRVGVDSDGRPSVSSRGSDCSFYVGSVSVTLHGGASWFYNLFDGNIAGAIKNALNGQICSTIINAVNTNLENELRKLQVVAPINNLVEIDYSLVASPSFNGSVNTAHKGEVYPYGSKAECPYPVPTIPPDPDSSRMVFVWITDYLPKSAVYVLQNIGFLQYNVTQKNVPPDEKTYLNTSNFALKFVIPQISKMYPNMGMQINVNSTKTPEISIQPDQLRAVLVGDFSPYAMLPNKTLAYLFTLNVTINTKANVSFHGNNVTWKISAMSTQISLVRSAVGTFNINLLQTAINTAISAYFIPDLNKYGATGVPLPQLEGFHFIKPTVIYGQKFLKIGTDITYTP